MRLARLLRYALNSLDSDREFRTQPNRFPQTRRPASGSPNPVQCKSIQSAGARVPLQALHRGPDLFGCLPPDVIEADELLDRHPTQITQALISCTKRGFQDYGPETETMSEAHFLTRSKTHAVGLLSYCDSKPLCSVLPEYRINGEEPPGKRKQTSSFRADRRALLRSGQVLGISTSKSASIDQPPWRNRTRLASRIHSSPVGSRYASAVANRRR